MDFLLNIVHVGVEPLQLLQRRLVVGVGLNTNSQYLKVRGQEILGFFLFLHESTFQIWKQIRNDVNLIVRDRGTYS